MTTNGTPCNMYTLRKENTQQTLEEDKTNVFSIL